MIAFEPKRGRTPFSSVNAGASGIRGAAGDRDHRRELGVAEAGERAAEARDKEGERHRRARPLGDRGGGAHEKSRADDRADAEGDQRKRTERPLQRRLTARGDVGHEAIE